MVTASESRKLPRGEPAQIPRPTQIRDDCYRTEGDRGDKLSITVCTTSFMWAYCPFLQTYHVYLSFCLTSSRIARRKHLRLWQCSHYMYILHQRDAHCRIGVHDYVNISTQTYLFTRHSYRQQNISAYSQCAYLEINIVLLQHTRRIIQTA